MTKSSGGRGEGKEGRERERKITKMGLTGHFRKREKKAEAESWQQEGGEEEKRLHIPEKSHAGRKDPGLL